MADKRLTLLKRANKLFRQGKTDAAIKEYKNILAIKSDDLEVRRIVGDLQLRQNQIKEAVEQFQWIAGHYLKEGFNAKAIAMFKRITRIDPTNEDSLFKLADLYTRQGLIMEAKQIYLDVAEECKRQGNQKKALGMYKKILEFDRSNIKMRCLLADNYLKEGMTEDAVTEYLTASNILLGKKDYRRAENLLLGIIEKLKAPVLLEKLVYCYTSQQEDDKAIDLLSTMGPVLDNNINLLKTLGELYLKRNQMTEAEQTFIKIAQLDPEETEVIMRLGKVYLQREEYDRTYDLFLPIVDKNIHNSKFEEAASLLRFIIASNNTYLPALIKLAAIFEVSGKTNNLIALYESLIPIYEKKGMVDELRKVLEKLIQLSEAPFTYEEQLEKLNGKIEQEKEVESEEERESEFIIFHLRVAEDALKLSDFTKAINTLVTAKSTFPNNVDIRIRLFDVYRIKDMTAEAVEEGKELLDLYKAEGLEDARSNLLEQLSQLSPDDEKLMEMSGDEKTSIDIDIPQEELVEEMAAISSPEASSPVIDDKKEHTAIEEDLLVLSEAHSVFPISETEAHTEPPVFQAPAAPVSSAPVAASPPAQDEKQYTDSGGESLDTYLSELDFYINDRYFADAEKLIATLQQRFAGNEQLMQRVQRLLQSKGEVQPEAISLPHEPEAHARSDTWAGESKHEHTEPLLPVEPEFVLEGSGGDERPMVPPPEPQFEVPAPPESSPEISAIEEPMDLLMSHEDLHGVVETPPREAEEQPIAGFDLEDDLMDFRLNDEPESGEAESQEFGDIPLTVEMEEPARGENFMDSVSAPSFPPPPMEPSVPFAPPDQPEPPTPPMAPAPPAPPQPETAPFDMLQEEAFPLDGDVASPEMFPLESSHPEISQPEFLPLDSSQNFSPGADDPFPEAPDSEGLPFDVGSAPVSNEESQSFLEIEHSIAEESHMAQEFEDSRVGIKIEEIDKSDSIRLKKEELAELDDVDFEIEFEESDRDRTSNIKLTKAEQDKLTQSPQAVPVEKDFQDSHELSGIEDLDLSSVMEDETSAIDMDSPFKEITSHDLAFEQEDDLLSDESMFLEETYYEIENNVPSEMEAILHWLKEVEKQRTSTIEKNMMEIFDEFKKGVDEKIGQEDYDTRYNLGIAYKEMGLLEEAIHEFLISSKHSLKFFDSAGLLGICFRDKGMYSEAVNWFEKALKTPDRKEEEYLAVTFELVITYNLLEEFIPAKKYAANILKRNPEYRNIREIYEELGQKVGDTQ